MPGVPGVPGVPGAPGGADADWAPGGPAWRTAVIVLREAGIAWIPPFADAIRACGGRPVLLTGAVADAERDALAALVERIVTVADPYDVEESVAAITAACGPGNPPTGVITWSDAAIVTAARTAAALGVARTDPKVLELARNKYAVRRALREAGLPTPGFALISGADQAEAVAREVGLPAIVKPVNGSGSHLVRCVHSAAELAAAYEELAARIPAGELADNYKVALGSIDPARQFLVEGRLRGPEASVDVVIRDGVVEDFGLVGKFLMDDKFFELGLVKPPLDVPEDRTGPMVAAACAAALALGLDQTVAHIEVMDDEVLGPVIVEVNPGRPGGALVGQMLSLTTGVHMAEEAVAAATGLPRPERQDPQLPIPMALCMFYPTGSGRLTALDGVAELEAHPDVLSVVTTVAPGDVLSDEYEVFAVNALVAGYADHEDLLDVYHAAQSLLRFEFEPVPEAEPVTAGVCDV
ncbi:biotin carboxylase [Catenulispora sp. EB89]|uniref:ATP-grasp domain-containing protein n=1 Tax=Catenulispora sp. EB89 TaxID=3156257 RepID=UPI003519D69E